jgi:hypothetical protein
VTPTLHSKTANPQYIYYYYYLLQVVLVESLVLASAPSPNRQNPGFSFSA